MDRGIDLFGVCTVDANEPKIILLFGPVCYVPGQTERGMLALRPARTAVFDKIAPAASGKAQFAPPFVNRV